jgi:hydrogenase maturation protease
MSAMATSKEYEPDTRRAVIVGLGNPIRTDDAVGLAVARAVHTRLARPDIELCELAAGGLELVERLAGYARAVIIDAVQGGGGQVGECCRLEWERGSGSQRTGGTHEVGLLEGLELARRLGVQVPEVVRVYVVEVADPYTFGTEMSAPVRDAVPAAAEKILAEEYGLVAQASGLPAAGTAAPQELRE